MIHVSPAHSALVCRRCGGMLVQDGGEVGVSCIICARPYPPAHPPPPVSRLNPIGRERRRVTESQAHQIRALRADGRTQREIALAVGVDRSSVRYHLRRRIKQVAGYGP